MSDINIPSVLLGNKSIDRPTTVIPIERQRLLLALWLVFVDATALLCAFYAAYVTRFSWSVTVAPDVAPTPEFYANLTLVLVPLFIGLFFVFRLYHVETLLGGVTEYSRLFNTCTHGFMLLVLATFIDTDLTVSRTWVVASWVYSCCTLMTARFLTRRGVYALRNRGLFLSPALVVGDNAEAQMLYNDLSDGRSSGLDLVGCVATKTSREGAGHTIGSLDDLGSLITQYHVEDVIVAITAVDRNELIAVCEEVNPRAKARLRLSSGLYELLTTGVTVEVRGPVPLIGINKARLEPNQLLAKTAFEFVTALFLVALLAPVYLLIAVAIRLDSQGPAIHRRRVLGVGGREFDAFKFRTMYVDGDKRLHSQPELQAALRKNHKLRNDPRVTRTGRFLRRYSLDELPQLFNVLRGEMGLVGPRMISPAEATKYGQHRLNLLTVRPGITGLWQVSGRSDLSYEERIRLDMLYIRNYSIWSDLQILWIQTLPAVLSGRGAY